MTNAWHKIKCRECNGQGFEIDYELDFDGKIEGTEKIHCDNCLGLGFTILEQDIETGDRVRISEEAAMFPGFEGFVVRIGEQTGMTGRNILVGIDLDNGHYLNYEKQEIGLING